MLLAHESRLLPCAPQGRAARAAATPIPASAPGTPELCTERVRLRQWRERDLAPFAALNRDAEVMRFLPAPLTRAESDALAAQIRAHFQEVGFGLWALEIPGVREFAGFVGLSRARFPAPFTPCIEIGWRLARECWGAGYASEAAREVLRFAHDTLELPEVVSFTATDNQRSRRVMERIGLQRDPSGDFDHPRLPAGHPLRRHVLYRGRRA
jgi:RimJ/RimL family protein N-acetyltransferase